MIKVYEKKQTLVDSIQWNGDNYVEVTKFIVKNTVKNTKKTIQRFTHCEDDTFMITFTNKEVMVIKNGDFVVLENDNILVVSEEVFEKNYRFVGVRSEYLERSASVCKEIPSEKLVKDLLKALEENGITVCD